MEKKIIKTIIGKLSNTYITSGKPSNLSLAFTNETQLAKLVNQSEWFKPSCGHDCCTCNVECK